MKKSIIKQLFLPMFGITSLLGACSTNDLEEPENNQDGDLTSYTVNGVSFKMVTVRGGTFTMGATPEQENPTNDELTTHQVTLSPYYIGETEVTQELWQTVMGNKPTDDTEKQWSPSYGLGAKHPAYFISWNDVQEFITKLNSLTGKTFRLPTEAEWEFAARGGNKSKGFQYSGGNNTDDVAWYNNNSYDMGIDSPDYGTHPVKTKSPNELGIYDMSGNVFEWCSDWYDLYELFCSSTQTDPKGPASGFLRVNRGGSWCFSNWHCRTAYRCSNPTGTRQKDLGFRLALSFQP